MATELAPTEIKALARILDELDYYGLLHVPPGADSGELKRAYFASSRAFHPDASVLWKASKEIRLLCPEPSTVVRIEGSP